MGSRSQCRAGATSTNTFNDTTPASGLDPGPVEQRLGIGIGAAARLAAGNTISSPVGTIICIIPSRCMLANRHLGALIGIWWKALVPSRDFCLSS